MLVFVSKGRFYCSTGVARALYQKLGQLLCERNVFSLNVTPESFAEIRIYIENFSNNFDDVYCYLPNNLFNVPLTKVEELEAQYWQDIFSDNHSDIRSYADKSHCSSYYLPTSIVTKNTFDFASQLNTNSSDRRYVVEKKEFSPKKNTQNSWFYDLGYTTLGSAFCAYGIWVNHLNSGNTLWGLMRDGEFLSKICSELGATIGGNLFISRMSAIRAAMVNVDDKNILKNFLLRSHTCSLLMRDAIALMGVSENSELPIGLDCAISTENLDTVVKWANRSLIKEQRYASSLDMLNKVLNHLNQSGVPSDKDLILLDLGYAGNILSNLNSVFKYSERQQICRGRFVFSSVGAVWAQKNDCEILGCLVQNGAPYDFATVYYRSPELLELCCAPKCGTTLDYHNDGTPICASRPLPEWQYCEISDVQQGILQFVKDWKSEVNYSAETFDYKGFGQMIRDARQKISRLVDQPTEEEAEKIGRWLYDDTADGDLFSLVELRSKGLDPKCANRSELYWPQAYKALNPNV